MGAYTVCLAHLSGAERAAHLAGLRPGDDVDHRGTSFTAELLRELLAALADPATQRARLGQALFQQAEFTGEAAFDEVGFDGHAQFEGARFAGPVSFQGARFGGAWFRGAEFEGPADFGGAEFRGDASFRDVRFGGGAWFGGAEFQGEIWFAGSEVRGDAGFLKVAFHQAAALGPLVCTGTVDLSEAVFGAAVTIEAATAALHCRRTRWASTAVLRLRHAVVTLDDAVLEYPVSIAARSRPFTVDGAELTAPDLTDPRVRLTSLRGVDAAHLVLSDLDLTACRFAGAVHLDQLRLEGLYTFASAPSGLRRRGMLPLRWTARRTLAEEHHWRATRATATDGWTPPAQDEDVLQPAALAPVYRQLRKSFEDAKHEPGAADFYYGEMEMRRHAHDIPWAERGLLTAYWALSGYGLRASRALLWLLTAMAVTVLAMMLWGLPQDDPRPRSTGTVTGGAVTMTTDTPDPVNPSGPYRRRLTTERFEKSLRVVVNSVVFRSSGQNLTTAGTYTEMASRLAEPLLLGFVVLAVRGRVKR